MLFIISDLVNEKVVIRVVIPLRLKGNI